MAATVMGAVLAAAVVGTVKTSAGVSLMEAEQADTLHMQGSVPEHVLPCLSVATCVWELANRYCSR